MVFTERQKRALPDPLPDLRLPIAVEPEGFTNDDVAAIFKYAIHESQVSRWRSLFPNIKPYELINRDGVWDFYIFLAWRRKKTLKDGTRHTWKRHFQQEFAELGPAIFLQKYVYSQGGSRDHCNQLIDNFLASKNTKKFA